MKVSQNWLKNLVEITSTPEDLSEKLSIGGFEVESLEDCSVNVNGVVLGKVLSVLKHEGSDKLSICQVDIGNSKNLQIICGARNIKSNIYVYVATVGAKLNAVDLTIKRSEIRGVMSEGMICSLQELGLEDSSEGIEIIDDDLALKHELGTPGSELLQLNDFIYDLAITAGLLAVMAKSYIKSFNCSKSAPGVPNSCFRAKSSSMISIPSLESSKPSSCSEHLSLIHI